MDNIRNYGKEGGWCSCEVRNRFGVGLWKALRKDLDLLFVFWGLGLRCL